MLRATMVRPGNISFEEVARPPIADHEVLVRVQRIGICGSDIHVFHGTHPYTGYPVTQGHEFSGRVEAVGPSVRSIQPGALVTAPPQVVCGECVQCRNGQEHICDELKVMGFQAPGAAQELVTFHEDALLTLPSTFTPEVGALVEPVAVAVHAVRRAGEVWGKRIVVLGAGPIGNLVAQVARWRGARDVIITDVLDRRLGIAEACGIRRTLNTERTSLRQVLVEAFGPARADLIFECVGSEATANQAIREARKGSTIVIVGVFGDVPRVDLGLVQDRELRVVGSLMYQRRDYEDAIACLASGEVITHPLLTCTFPFRQFLDAYQFIEANRERVMKVMIDVEDTA